jgi:hypothetical protein
MYLLLFFYRVIAAFDIIGVTLIFSYIGALVYFSLFNEFDKFFALFVLLIVGYLFIALNIVAILSIFIYTVIEKIILRYAYK